MRRAIALLAATALLTSCSGKKENTSSKSSASKKTEAPVQAMENLLLENCTWYPTSDTIGSVIDTGAAMKKGDELKASFTLTPKTGDEWPYVELIATPDAGFVGKKQIRLTYKCDRKLLLKLAQKDFGPKGDNSYAYYQSSVPASKEWKDTTVIIETFAQPTWAPEAAKAIAYTPENITSLYLIPEISTEKGGSGTIELQLLNIQ